MPEFEITLIFSGRYEDTSDAFEQADMAAHYVERADPSLTVDVRLAEVGP